jgi:hypothetical protein
MLATRSRLAVFLVVFSVAAPAVAQPPDFFREYQFLTGQSTLAVQGGFAGFDIELPIYGEFGFVTGYHSDFTSLNPYAAFLNVDAQAINPTDFGPYSFDIDDSLNLSGLDGVPLPTGEPFDLYRFEGVDGQGAPMELHVATLGRWLYMRGANEPPCCDFFQYEIRALARQMPHPDFDGNGLVDSADLAYWEAHAGIDAAADLDGNGMTDGADFLALQRELGLVPPTADYFDALISAALADGPLAASVPEPLSLGLLVVGFLAVWGHRPTRRAGTFPPTVLGPHAQS